MLQPRLPTKGLRYLKQASKQVSRRAQPARTAGRAAAAVGGRGAGAAAAGARAWQGGGGVGQNRPAVFWGWELVGAPSTQECYRAARARGRLCGRAARTLVFVWVLAVGRSAQAAHVVPRAPENSPARRWATPAAGRVCA
jgi:hypothetical protein